CFHLLPVDAARDSNDGDPGGTRVSLRPAFSRIGHRPALAAHSRPRCPRAAWRSRLLAAGVESARRLPRVPFGRFLMGCDSRVIFPWRQLLPLIEPPRLRPVAADAHVAPPPRLIPAGVDKQPPA